MIGRTLAAAVAVLLSTQVQAQTNQNGPGPGSRRRIGPGGRVADEHEVAAGRPARDEAPGERGTDQSQSVRNKTHQATGKNNNDETGATGSSSPRYAPAPR